MTAVLVIIGVVLIMVFPDLSSSLDRCRLYVSCRDLAGEIRYLQQRAINGETNQLLYVDSSHKDRYQLRYIAWTSKGERPGAVIKTVFLHQGVEFQVFLSELKFTTSGAPNSGATYRLQNGSGQIYDVTVLPATGRVRIRESSGS